MKMNTQQSKTYGTQQGSPEREVHSNIGPPKKDRNISNKQPNPMPRRTQRTTQTHPRANRRKEITKTRAELNDIETKRTIQRIIKPRSLFYKR